jgi:hypothetical protein
MLIPDADLTVEIRDYKKEIANLLAFIKADRASGDRERLRWLEEKCKELQTEMNRRCRQAPSSSRPPAASSGTPSANSVHTVQIKASKNNRPSNDDFEGPPIIIMENGTPRLWRPGDRIHRKR